VTKQETEETSNGEVERLTEKEERHSNRQRDRKQPEEGAQRTGGLLGRREREQQKDK